MTLHKIRVTTSAYANHGWNKEVHMKELDSLVTQDHIDIGCTDSRHCPVALSLSESTGLHHEGEHGYRRHNAV